MCNCPVDGRKWVGSDVFWNICDGVVCLKCFTEFQICMKETDDAIKKYRAEMRKQEKIQKRKREVWSRTSTTVCGHLRKHHEILKDDPERLSTEFLKNLIEYDDDCEWE